MRGLTQEEQKVTWVRGSTTQLRELSIGENTNMISFAILGFPLAYSTSCPGHDLVTSRFSGETNEIAKTTQVFNQRIY